MLSQNDVATEIAERIIKETDSKEQIITLLDTVVKLTLGKDFKVAVNWDHLDPP